MQVRFSRSTLIKTAAWISAQFAPGVLVPSTRIIEHIRGVAYRANRGAPAGSSSNALDGKAIRAAEARLGIRYVRSKGVRVANGRTTAAFYEVT